MGDATVVVLEADSLSAALPRPQLPHRWNSYARTAPEQIVERLLQAEVAIINKCRLDAVVLARLPALRMVALSATGCDNVDLDVCRERGIVVSNVPDYAADTVAEHALMLMFALRRQLLGYRELLAEGAWSRAPGFCLNTLPVADLAEATLCIVGRGALGQGLASRATALGMQVLFAERRGERQVREGYVAFDAALAMADVVSLHCPLNDRTRHLLGAREFSLMKPGALLINTARGGLIDEFALLAALEQGRLGGAGLDVLSVEPPPRDHLLLRVQRPDLIITPHVAWASARAVSRLALQTIANVEAYLRGAPINLVA